MHFYEERYQPLRLPVAGTVVESLRVCAPQPQAASGTCLPLSVTKSPVPTWPGYLQPLRLLCAAPRAAALPLLRGQPCAPRAVLLGREACEAAAQAAHAVAVACSPQPCLAGRPERRRVAKSLPPCAPRCPEPGKLRFPPCGIRYSSSCRGEHAAAASRGSKRAVVAARAGPGGYSRPLQGGTECPQERALPERVLRERALQERAGSFPLQRCTKGYPTQDCVSPCLLQPLDTKPPPVPCVARGSAPHRAKARCPGSPHAAKVQGTHPCAPLRAARPHGGAGKGSSHGKKSRCGAKWFW